MVMMMMKRRRRIGTNYYTKIESPSLLSSSSSLENGLDRTKTTWINLENAFFWRLETSSKKLCDDKIDSTPNLRGCGDLLCKFCQNRRPKSSHPPKYSVNT